MSYNRLDDRSIEDVVLRSLFHQEVIKRSASFHEDNHDYTIRLDEVYRSDLAAHRAYEGISDIDSLRRGVMESEGVVHTAFNHDF